MWMSQGIFFKMYGYQLIHFYFLILSMSFSSTVNLDFEEGNIKDVIDYIAKASGVNIVLGKDVSGTLTIKMFDVSWQYALETVLKLTGYASKKFDNIIYIDTPENLIEEAGGLRTFVAYKVRDKNLQEISKQIEPLLSPKGKFFSDDRTGQVVVFDNIDVQQRVKALIASLDTPVRQIGVNVKVINVTNVLNEALEQKWNFPILQVPIIRSLLALNKEPSIAGYTQIKIGYLPVGDSFFQLNLLSETSNTKEIAGGYLLMQENCEGSITVGDRFGVPMRDLAGNTVIQFYSSGFKLVIVSHSVTGDKVKLNVKFEMSSLDRAAALVGRPIISTYESEVEITLSDGETGVISRRIETETGAKENLPCYFNVPLIKYLFRPWSRIKNFTNQYILITPKIMS